MDDAVEAAPMGVLLVDDDERVLRGMARRMRRHFVTYTARCGDDALLVVAHARIGVVVADYRMPGMNGVTLLDEIQRIDEQMVRVLHTSYTPSARGGEYLHITKPCAPDDLIALVAELLKRAGAQVV